MVWKPNWGDLWTWKPVPFLYGTLILSCHPYTTGHFRESIYKVVLYGDAPNERFGPSKWNFCSKVRIFSLNTTFSIRIRYKNMRLVQRCMFASRRAKQLYEAYVLFGLEVRHEDLMLGRIPTK